MADPEPQRLPPLAWRESPNFSSRHGEPVRMIVIHTAEGPYEGSVSWLCNPASDASSHIVLSEDGSEATQLVRYDDKAWTQVFFNPACISIECAGALSTRFLRPVKALSQMRRLARIVAFLLKKNKLPPVWVRNQDRFSGKGYTRHGDLAPEGGHPFCKLYTFTRWAMFRGLVLYEYRRGHFRKSWGR